MGVLAIFPNVPSWVTMIVFFALVFFFGCDKGKVVDKLGKYLTPLLLILLAIVLVKGVISPIGTPQDTGISKPLPSAMLTGYLTGDLTVGLMCANIFIGGILDKGHTNPLERKRSGLIVGLTSIVALGIIYIILTYIGACGGDYYDLSVPQTTLLSGLVGRVLGSFGKVCMGLAVSLACLTTAIGIGSTAPPSSTRSPRAHFLQAVDGHRLRGGRCVRLLRHPEHHQLRDSHLPHHVSHLHRADRAGRWTSGSPTTACISSV